MNRDQHALKQSGGAGRRSRGSVIGPSPESLGRVGPFVGNTIAVHGRVLLWLGWSLAGLATLSAHIFLGLPLLAAVQGVSFLCLGFGVWGFLHHGGPAITAAGCFTAATGAFVGYAGIWWTLNIPEVVNESFLKAVFAGFFTVLMLYFAVWWGTRHQAPVSDLDHSIRHQAAILGAVLAGGSLVAHMGVPARWQLYTQGGATVGILILAASFALRGSLVRQFMSLKGLALLGLLVIFIAFVFTGEGRLIVVVLLAAVAVLLSQYRSTRMLKLVGVGTAPLVANLASWLRVDRVEGYTAVTMNSVDSDVGGIKVFRDLIESQGSWDMGWGETFVTALLAWVPRTIWEGKPRGFGSELTLIFRPEIAAAGHSMVSTAYGEWFYNFGWLGLLIMVPVFGMATRWFDSARSRHFGNRVGNISGILTRALFAFLTALMVQYVWGSMFSAVARFLVPGGIFFCVFLALWLNRQKSGR